jgi:dihydrodipicolinate synthase/N-acetylneuraminate lyase
MVAAFFSGCVAFEEMTMTAFRKSTAFAGAKEQLKRTVSGIVVPLVTPLDIEDSLDCEALARVIAHVIRGGVSGIFILGTTGEGPSLSYELRAQLIESACRLAAGRVPVLVAVTDNVYERTRAMTHVAERAGASAVVLAPPCYFRISQTDLLHYVKRFAGESPLPVFLYNIPSLMKTMFDPDTVRRASEFSNVVGFKDSSGDLKYLSDVIRTISSEVPVMMGPEEMLLDAMQAGAVGGVCGGANLNPHLFTELHRLTASGDLNGAMKLQTRVREISDALYTVGDRGTSYLRGLKSAMAAAGLCSAKCAIPISPFTAEEGRQLQLRFDALGCTV